MTNCFLAASYVSWNMPDIGWALPAAFSSRTVPEYQNPSRSTRVTTVARDRWAGPIGEAGALPSQCQVPRKYFSSASSEAGFGTGAGSEAPGLSAGTAGAAVATTTTTRDRTTHRALMSTSGKIDPGPPSGAHQARHQRLQDPAPVHRAQPGLAGPLGVRHQPDDVPRAVAHARDRAEAAVGVGLVGEPSVLRRVAEDDLAVLLQPVELVVPQVEVALAVGDRHREDAAHGDARGGGGVVALDADVHRLREELDGPVAEH